MGKTEVAFTQPLAVGVTKEKALSILHNHDVYFAAAESFSTCEKLAGQGTDEKLPPDLKSRALGGAEAYKVRNEVPNPVFDSKVDSTYQMVNLDDGLWYVTQSPMGVSNEGHWTISEGANGLELHARFQIECNVALRPLVKGQVEKSSKQIAEALAGKMKA